MGYRVEINGEYLSRYLNTVGTVSLRNCPCDHSVTNKAYFKRYHSDKHFSELPTRWRQQSAGIDMEQNYVALTLCIDTGVSEVY